MAERPREEGGAAAPAGATVDAGPVELEALKETARKLPGTPGVYRMLDRRGAIIYVGKARSLKNRVSSYFTGLDTAAPKVRAMVRQIAGIDVTVTHTENEALILESNLIKENRPRYNVVLRDDKSYPYIYVSTDHAFPRLAFHRGAKSGKGRYFGPYPSAGAVRQTLNLLQKLFRVRQCEESFFRNRTRPCLQHQIDRCTAPCVGIVSEADYAVDVEHALLFLEGRSDEVIAVLGERMEAASAALEFEQAARLRDQIAYLQKVRQQQAVATGGGDADIIAADVLRGSGCIQVFYVRGGLNLGNKAFFPAHTDDVDRGGLLAAFLAQYYISRRPDREVPREIIVNAAVPDLALLESAISEHTGRRVSIRDSVRGERRRMLELASNNARLALEARLSANADSQARWAALAEAFEVGEGMERVECFDISHTQGEKTVASCVVFDRDGARKSDYRRFNIRDVAGGDDYAAMRQALERRYLRIKTEAGTFPDLLLVDGGKGQVNMARELLEELQIDNLPVVGVAKGPERRPGMEVLIMHDGRTERRLPAASPALLLIQQIRDEAHRFAITGHRAQRGKARQRSTLEDIAGIGGKRRAQLIRHFGGLQGVERAGIEELSKVPGISRDLARRIYERFHQQG